MSKTDRKKKLAAKKRAIAESARRGEILASTPKRKPSGRRKEPKGGWNQSGPTPEEKARREALLPNGRGCVDDWIDVAEGAGLLTSRLAEALCRYRGIIRAFAKMSGAPGIWSKGGVTGFTGETEEEEIEFRRLKNALESVKDALNAVGRKDEDTLAKYINSAAMPTSAEMERIRRAAAPVAEYFGL